MCYVYKLEITIIHVHVKLKKKMLKLEYYTVYNENIEIGLL